MNIEFALFVFFSLLLLLLLSVCLGCAIGKWQKKRHPAHKTETLAVVEGAVFALLGLLIAFTFTGAYERFEARKMHIIEEANAIETAYLRTALLPQKSQNELRAHLREYLDLRINMYKNLYSTDVIMRRWDSTLPLRKEIWNETINDTRAMANPAVALLVVPAIDNMFSVATIRLAITHVHPPTVIFALLILLAMLSSLLAGYSLSNSKKALNSVYIITYTVVMAFTIYLVIDLELPRFGLIRVDNFDQELIDLQNTFNKE